MKYLKRKNVKKTFNTNFFINTRNKKPKNLILQQSEGFKILHHYSNFTVRFFEFK